MIQIPMVSVQLKIVLPFGGATFVSKNKVEIPNRKCEIEMSVNGNTYRFRQKTSNWNMATGDMSVTLTLVSPEYFQILGPDLLQDANWIDATVPS